ncbi:MAG: ParB N-terminal domain-containing protein [Acidobacteriota bacterium]|nr:ParB N-terminal domain-containing protein [Acidobacteriota bacterium]
MKVSLLKKNPGNPREIRDEKFELLKRSIKEFPEMMRLRPIVVDADMKVLGGNMRLAAIKTLGMKEIPDDWVMRAEDLTDEQKKEFIIKDNNSFGQYDWDILTNEWSDFPLEEWGLDLPSFDAVEDVEFKEYTEDVENEVQFITCPNCEHKFPK